MTMVFPVMGSEERKLSARSGIEWRQGGSDQANMSTVLGHTRQHRALLFGEVNWDQWEAHFWKLLSRGPIYWKYSCKEIVWKACTKQTHGGIRKTWVKKAGMLLHSPWPVAWGSGPGGGWYMWRRKLKGGRLDMRHIGYGTVRDKGKVFQEEECQER